jgi:hypothetical protein
MVGCQLAASPWNNQLLSYYAIKDMTTTYFSYWLLFIGVVQLCLFVCLFVLSFFFGVGRNGEILVLQVWSRWSFADWHYYITMSLAHK